MENEILEVLTSSHLFECGQIRDAVNAQFKTQYPYFTVHAELNRLSKIGLVSKHQPGGKTYLDVFVPLYKRAV